MTEAIGSGWRSWRRAFDVRMRSPTGEEHWVRGRFVEVTRHTRLVIDMTCTDRDGKGALRRHNRGGFFRRARRHANGRGAKLHADRSVGGVDDERRAGWLAHDAGQAGEGGRAHARWRGVGYAHGRVVHAVFHLERSYDAPVARVWQALTDEAAKSKWFGGSPGKWELLERRMDVRVGGTERVRGRWEGGVVSCFERDLPRRRRIPETSAWSTATPCIWTSKKDLGIAGDAAAYYGRHGWKNDTEGERTRCIPGRLRRCRVTRTWYRIPAGCPGSVVVLMTCKVIDFAGRPGDSWCAQTVIGCRRAQEREFHHEYSQRDRRQLHCGVE